MRQDLVDFYGDDDLLFADEFDDAIIGVSDGRVCYDKEMMVHILCTKDDMDRDEAYEYLEFNTWGAYIGEKTPLYIDVYYFNKVRNHYENQIHINGQTTGTSADE